MEENSNIIVSQNATESLIQDLRQIIEQARGHVAATANYAQTMMYWHIGERINREVLGNQRAEYGKQIVSTVSTQLQEEYGKKGFEPRSIWRMMQFAEDFPDFKIVSAVSTQLTWSHIIEILPLKDDLQREFYLTFAASERWSVRRLRKEIDGMLFVHFAAGCIGAQRLLRDQCERPQPAQCPGRLTVHSVLCIRNGRGL